VRTLARSTKPIGAAGVATTTGQLDEVPVKEKTPMIRTKHILWVDP